VPPVQLEKVVGLEDHVVELEEGERRLAREALLDGLEGEHAVDGKVPAVVAQEGEVRERREPRVVVDE